MKSGEKIRLTINEVATRDGFQMEQRFIPTADKVALIDRLSDLGYAKIEVTSFTSPKAIPTLADGADVMERIRRQPGVIYTALIPNMKGAERAVAARVDEFNLVMSCSETHNLSNLRMMREQSFKQLTDVIGLDTIRHATSSRSVRALAAVRIHSINPRSARPNIRTAIAQQRFWRGPEP